MSSDRSLSPLLATLTLSILLACLATGEKGIRFLSKNRYPRLAVKHDWATNWFGL